EALGDDFHPLTGAPVVAQLVTSADRPAKHELGRKWRDLAADRPRHRFVDHPQAVRNLTLADAYVTAEHQSERLQVGNAESLSDRERTLGRSSCFDMKTLCDREHGRGPLEESVDFTLRLVLNQTL